MRDRINREIDKFVCGLIVLGIIVTTVLPMILVWLMIQIMGITILICSLIGLLAIVYIMGIIGIIVKQAFAPRDEEK